MNPFDRCAAKAVHGGRCWQSRSDHVHQAVPCENGQPLAHHDFKPDVAAIADELAAIGSLLKPADTVRLMGSVVGAQP